METKEYNEIKRGLIAAYHALRQAYSSLFQGTQVNQITEIMRSIRVCVCYKDERLRAAAETLLTYADFVFCYDKTFSWGELRGTSYRKDLNDKLRQEAARFACHNFYLVMQQAERNVEYCLKQLDENNGEGGKA